MASSTSPFDSLFGSTLLGKAGELSTADELSGKVVGVYFSAHWCPPCKMFTPQLAIYYEKLKAQQVPFEIVFCSSDRDEGQFNKYYSEMPWLAVPYSARSVKESLSSKYRVSGIPTLVFLNENGEIITRNGRECVSSDPEGTEFPYSPKPFYELIGNEFIAHGSGSETSIVTKDHFAGKYIGVYFSAHWCGPCRNFTPQLVPRYNLAKSKELPFEIIFISWDNDESSFHQYFSEMPWIALPFNQQQIKEKLNRLFDVQGIPTLVIVNPEGKVENKDGRFELSNDPQMQNFPWTPSPLVDLSKGAAFNGLSINDCPTFVCLMENSDDSEQSEISQALSNIASSYVAQNPDSPEFLFMAAKNSGDIPNKIRQLVRAPNVRQASDPAAYLLDIQNNGAFYNFSGDLTSEDSIRQFIQAYKSGGLPRQQLG
jgi:nucleoredoxin